MSVSKTQIIEHLLKTNKDDLINIKNKFDLMYIVLHQTDLIIEKNISISHYESLLEQIKQKGESVAIENRIKGMSNNILSDNFVTNSSNMMSARYHYLETCLRPRLLNQLKEL